MVLIRHKFITHKINPNTETLIIGTFNPESENNEADFFYGRARNYLWKLLPTAFNKDSLKGKSKDDKVAFINKYKIDFIDLIASVDVEYTGNYNDAYLDNKVKEWRDVISEINNLTNLKKICITRKTFSDVPCMKGKVDLIKEHSLLNGVKFQLLTTPARFYRIDKQKEWSNFLFDDNRQSE